MNNDLPAIEEAFDNENDTFAQGGPLAALKRPSGRQIEGNNCRRELNSQSSVRVRSNSQNRS
jgi:hypothetical protein